jgi:hypothetical protein
MANLQLESSHDELLASHDVGEDRRLGPNPARRRSRRRAVGRVHAGVGIVGAQNRATAQAGVERRSAGTDEGGTSLPELHARVG